MTYFDRAGHARPYTYDPTSSPFFHARTLTDLVAALDALADDLHARAAAGRLAPLAALKADEQLGKATRHARLVAPDKITLAVHLVAARAFLREAHAAPALTDALDDALALTHHLFAPGASPTPVFSAY